MKSLSQVKKYNNLSLAFRWVKLYNSVADAETPLGFICTDQKRTRKRFFFFDFCRWSKWTLKLNLFEPIWKRWPFLLSLSHPYMQLKSLWLPLEALIFFRSILQEHRPSSVGWFRLYLEYQYPLADVRGCQGRPRVQILSFLCSFRQKNLQNNPNLPVGAPPRENPGSATDNIPPRRLTTQLPEDFIMLHKYQ